MADGDPCQLCSYCQKIDFNIFRLPLVAEMEAYHEQRCDPTFSGFFQKDQHRWTNFVALGTFSRILKNEENCGLCKIFGHLLRSQPTSPVKGLSFDEIGSSQDLQCHIHHHPLFGLLNNPLMIFRPSLRWESNDSRSSGGFEFCLQTLAQSSRHSLEDVSEGSELYFGGRERSLDINYDLMRGWLSLCGKTHGESCTSKLTGLRPINRFRLIDIQRLCLIEIENADLTLFQYATLSYVWGHNCQHRVDLRKETAHELMQPNGVNLDKLSPVVADYIEVVSQLHVPYAWVDALCILQDDELDMTQSVAAMSDIYQASTITIVNAVGKDLESNLPGVRFGSRSMLQQRITVPVASMDDQASATETLTFITSLNVGGRGSKIMLQDFAWSSRAWTYQERLLARRALIFTSEQVLWSCREAMFSEESRQEYCQSEVYPIVLDPILDVVLHGTTKYQKEYNRISDHDHKLLSYQTYVRTFSHRQLTFEGDVYNAFAGIDQAMSQALQTEFLWGMPVSRFAMSMAWTTSSVVSAVKRRLQPSSLKMTEKQDYIVFPSWAWMGWKGSVSLRITKQWEQEQFVSPKPHPKCPTNQHRYQSLIECNIHTNDPVQIQSLSPDTKSDLDITPKTIQRTYPFLTLDKLNTFPSTTLVFFHANVGYLHVRYPTDTQGWETSASNPLSYPRRPLDQPHILDTSRSEKIGELDCCISELALNDTDYEFTVIGRQAEQDEEIAAFLGDEGRPRLIVLQIGLGRADDVGLPQERLACGWVYEDMWERHARHKNERLVVLQ